MLLHTINVAIALLSLAGRSLADGDKKYKMVTVFSVDGFHGSDVKKYVSLRPNSTIAGLLETGFEYENAFTSAPSDSFPGTTAQYTGASPRTAGIWYDDIWVRDFFPPGSNCTGPPGAEVGNFENLDYNQNLLFSGGINPANLMKKIINGKCVEVYPHSRLRVNTVFEVVHEAGFVTAYADKHPAYDLVRGPSGTGLTEGYFPEINSLAAQLIPSAPAGDDFTANVDYAITWDTLHVQAFLGWLDGVSPANAEGSLNGAIPTLFGGNFQSVSVGQKKAGYEPDTLAFTPDLLKAIDFVDASLGQIVNKLKSKGLLDDTLIIVASKHGQASINPKLFGEVDPNNVQTDTDVPVLWETSDDIALLFLKDQSQTKTAVENLNYNSTALKIKRIIWGEELIDQGFGDPTKDPAVPDIIVQPDLGIIYTTSHSKIAEHGGLSNDDRHVACFVSNPGLKKRKFPDETSTRQVAPTILQALGLDPKKLQGAVAEGTRVLNGF